MEFNYGRQPDRADISSGHQNLVEIWASNVEKLIKKVGPEEANF